MNIGIGGICGRMGRRILAVAREKGLTVTVGLERSDYSQTGQDIPDFRVSTDPQAIKDCDCFIDFTSAEATIEHLSFLVKYKKSAVIGTTGFSGAQAEKIREAAGAIAIVFSPNMSVGVNLLFKIIREAARTLQGYGIYLEEAHHIHKKDAPSGTAKRIVQILNEEGFSVTNEDVVAIREDEIVGDHSIIFKSAVDEIEISHSAKTRDIFVQGAVKAAQWVVDKPAGLYTMDDVLFKSKEER